MSDRMKIQLAGRQKLLLGFAAGGLGLVLLIRFVDVPLIAGIRERRATLKALQVKSADAQALVVELPTQEQALERTREQFDVLERRVKTEESMARVLETLSQQAKDHRLELVAVQGRAQEGEQRVVSLSPELTLHEAPLTIQLTGRYRALGEFLAALAQMPFLASVQTLKVTRLEATGVQLHAEVVLAVYLGEQRSLP